MRHIERIVAAMRAGGYFERVMSGGPELDRVKDFLLICAGERPDTPPSPLQHPHYPCFPGLSHQAWRDPEQFEAARILQENFAVIRDEALNLPEAAPVDYTQAVAAPRSWKRPWTLLRPRPAAKSWTVYLLYHLGVNVEPVSGASPRTLAILNTLPRACLDYTWGDFIFSALNPGAHLPPHCSVDNFRVRLHLGVTTPEECGLRVGAETRTWRAGECLAFEDCFEHEAWNRSQSRRIVLIVDLWHPDLTDIEVKALTAAFRKSEVRRIVMHERMGVTDASARFLPAIEAALAEQDDEPLIKAFWG